MNATAVPLLTFCLCCATPTRRPSIAPLPCPAGAFRVVADTVGHRLPQPLALFIPPLPIPAAVNGRKPTARLVVDSAGGVMPDSITICGLNDVAYIRRLAQVLGRTPFAASQTDRPAPAYLNIEFNVSR